MSQEVHPVCYYLRTKYVIDHDTGCLGMDLSPTGHYRCLCTMTTAGPDNNFVAPEVCQPTRSCYKPPE